MIEKLLKSKQIQYVTSGHNVKKGNVNIACPLCKDDPSQHLGIDLKTGYWGCWRDKKHGHKDFKKLLIILGFSEQDIFLFSNQKILLDVDWYDSIERLFMKTVAKKIEKQELFFPEEFKDLKTQGVYSKFYNYLLERGVQEPLKWGFKACLTGEWKDRIIIPITFNNQLVTWLGRSIHEIPKKYLNLNNEKSVVSIKKTVYNYDTIKYGGKVLFITEGVFDCLNLTQYLPPNYYSTCLFSKIMLDEQASLFIQLSKKFKSLCVLLDNDAKKQAIQIQQELSFLNNIEVLELPDDVKDPGDLTFQQVNNLVQSI